MAYLVAPDGRALGDVVLPQYLTALDEGRLQITAGEPRAEATDG